MSAALARLRDPHAGTDIVHLNHAGFAPMCRAARDAGVEVLDRMTLGSAGDRDLIPLYERARASYARLVGCGAEDVSFFQTAAAAISQVALGLPLERGDEIVRLDQEYPSNAYPWHRAAERAGARVIVVPSSPRLTASVEQLIEAVTPRTRVLTVSSVQFQTGLALDLPPIVAACHAVGAVVCVLARSASSRARRWWSAPSRVPRRSTNCSPSASIACTLRRSRSPTVWSAGRAPAAGMCSAARPARRAVPS